MTTARRLALPVAVLALSAACGDDADYRSSGDRPEPAPATDWPGDGSATQVVVLGEDLVADLPTSWEVEPFADPGPNGVPGGECVGPSAVLRTGEGPLSLALHPVGCDPEMAIINGFHGTYTGLDEVPDPGNVEEHEVAAGSLVTFTQPYDEYTNQHTRYVDNVGLLELHDPPDPDRPTVMLLAAMGNLPMEGLVAVADAIEVRPSSTGADAAEALVAAGVDEEEAACVGRRLDATLTPGEMEEVAGATELDLLPPDLADQVRAIIDDCL